MNITTISTLVGGIGALGVSAVGAVGGITALVVRKLRKNKAEKQQMQQRAKEQTQRIVKEMRKGNQRDMYKNTVEATNPGLAKRTQRAEQRARTRRQVQHNPRKAVMNTMPLFQRYNKSGFTESV